MTETTDQPNLRNLIQKHAFPYLRFWSTLLVILILDQLSKWIIVDFSGFTRGLYPPFDGIVVIPGFFNLVYTVNYGAAWGMLQGFGWLLIVLAFVVLAMITCFRRDLGLGKPPQQWAFGLICAGILGNTIDRLFRGHVVDFLDFHLPMYRWPTFNVADSAIVVGTLIYLWLQFLPEKTESS